MTLIILISLVQITFAGPLCLTCRNVVDPGACSTVTYCGDHEECSMTKYLTTSGLMLYDLGCTDVNSCRSLSGKRSITEKDTQFGNYEICKACCNDGVVCNLGGMCGVKQFNFNGGTLCFACDQMTQPDNCGQITFCSADKVCHIGQKIVGLSGIKVYETRCANPHTECPNGVSSSNVVFGKRNYIMDHSNKRQSDKFCSGCCHTHMCNRNCSLSKQFLTTSTPTAVMTSTSPSNWSKCK